MEKHAARRVLSLGNDLGRVTAPSGASTAEPSGDWPQVPPLCSSTATSLNKLHPGKQLPESLVGMGCRTFLFIFRGVKAVVLHKRTALHHLVAKG